MHVRVRASKCMRGCLPFCHPEGWGNSISFYKLIRVLPSPGVGQCFRLFISPGIPCPGLPDLYFPLCLKYDLFRKTILDMLSVEHAFCERLYLCDFNRESLQSMEVVQTFNRNNYLTELLIGCRTSGIPRKFKAECKNIMSLRPQNANLHA